MAPAAGSADRLKASRERGTVTWQRRWRLDADLRPVADRLARDYEGVLPAGRVLSVVTRCNRDLRRMTHTRAIEPAGDDYADLVEEAARHRLRQIAASAARRGQGRS